MSQHTVFAVKHPTDSRLVWAKRGEVGFWESDSIAAPIETWNERQGITAEQADSALVGSVFGWDVPGARNA